MAGKGVDVGRERVARVRKRGETLAHLLAICGDEKDLTYGGQGFCVNPCHLKQVLRSCDELQMTHWRVDAVRRKVEATKAIRAKAKMLSKA